MKTGQKKVPLCEEDLEKESEFTFYVTMTLKERMEVREKMKRLRLKTKLPMARVLKEVLIKHLDDEEFLKYINLWWTNGKICYN